MRGRPDSLINDGRQIDWGIIKGSAMALKRA
jgi:hypothetical protein